MAVAMIVEALGDDREIVNRLNYRTRRRMRPDGLYPGQRATESSTYVEYSQRPRTKAGNQNAATIAAGSMPRTAATRPTFSQTRLRMPVLTVFWNDRGVGLLDRGGGGLVEHHGDQGEHEDPLQGDERPVRRGVGEAAMGHRGGGQAEEGQVLEGQAGDEPATILPAGLRAADHRDPGDDRARRRRGGAPGDRPAQLGRVGHPQQQVETTAGSP